jgi:hypothetical protein
VVVGDLSYAGDGSGYYTNGVPTGASNLSPANWDAYLGIVGPVAAQSIPWQVGVGNHEMEPLDKLRLRLALRGMTYCPRFVR